MLVSIQNSDRCFMMEYSIMYYQLYFHTEMFYLGYDGAIDEDHTLLLLL